MKAMPFMGKKVKLIFLELDMALTVGQCRRKNISFAVRPLLLTV